MNLDRLHQKALESYPGATPINEIIGLTQDDMIQHLGIKWTEIFKSSCMLGCRTWIRKGEYFIAVRGGDESIAPNETNIVTSKNWGDQTTNAVKAVRGCDKNLVLPTAYGSFTYNLDKGGNDIICSVRLGDRENGN